MRPLSILALVIALAGTARAGGDVGGDVGVVVTGEPSMQPQVKALIEGWLKSHGHRLVASPLPADSTAKLGDCFVLEDTSCARKLVEDKGASATIVLVRVDVGAGKDVTFTGYWFEKGHEPVAEKRVCERCSDTTLVMAGDELMSALLGSANISVGQLKLTSNPPGAQVVIDGKAAGATPLDVSLPAGAHQITLSADGRTDATKSVTIVKGQPTTLEVALEVPRPPPPPKSKLLPIAVIGAGGALLVGGIVLYATSETDTGEKPEYRDTRALGIGVAVSGLAVGGLGAYLLLRAKRPADSAPPPVSMSFVPGGATIGWRTAF